MKLLLDTHVLIWWLENNKMLTKKSRQKIMEANNVYISAGAIWEIIIKSRIGKLKIPDNLPQKLNDNAFKVLPIQDAHVYTLKAIPNYHRDPFDRIQIAQAKTENLTFVSKDKKVQGYNDTISILKA